MFEINFKALISKIHLERLILLVSKQSYIRIFRKKNVVYVTENSWNAENLNKITIYTYLY